MSPRRKPVLITIAAILVVWLLALGGYTLAKNSKMTAEKIRAFTESVDFGSLNGDARAKAIRDLANKLNALPHEERRRARMDRLMQSWFDQMTESEKAEFIELTMPTGFKQMIAAFEEMPEEKRQRAIDDSLKRLREARQRAQEQGAPPLNQGTNAPILSDELRDKITTIGLKSFYSQSSAQTKAEVAPVLEELQQTMEAGALFRGGRR